jgi:hypothetical protein
MTARFSVKNSHIEDDLIVVLKKQTPAVKVITVRLTVSKDIPGFHKWQARMFQYKTNTSRDIPVSNVPSIKIFKIFSR